MKRFSRWAVVVLVGALLAGCGQAEDITKRNANGTQNVKDLLNAEESKAQASKESVAESSETQQSEESSQAAVSSESSAQATSVSQTAENAAVDVDLAALSSTMVYSEVYNMMMTPDDYIGKTVKMSGAFSYFKDDSTGHEYFSCIIQDATAC
ncbi:MAG: hypothetical protein II477_08545, partial [Lachnospiraceae bacterium]|nr:hypothetical protein [Lachnospiraceae bacterium]